MHMPKLSVVIPCYNREHFLPETLESIQAYNGVHSYEIILVDDGSTSRATQAYLQTCRQIPHCRVICQPHAGPAAARNTGAGHAASDYILFLDSDNKIYANLFIDKGVAVLDQHPEAGVFYGNPSFFGDVTDDRVFTSGAFHFETMLRCNYIDMCSLVRKATWEEVGGLDENKLLMCYEDWDFWLRIGRTGWKFYYEDTVLFEYRITKGSLVTQATGAAHDKSMVCYIYQKHTDVLPQHLKAWCANTEPSE